MIGKKWYHNCIYVKVIFVMRNNMKKRLIALGAISILLCLFGALCALLAVLGEYDNAMGHFDRDALFVPALYGCMIAAVCLCIAARVILGRLKAPDRALPRSIILSVVSAAVGSAVLFLTVMRLLETFDGDTKADFFAVASIVLGLASSAYFYLSAFSKAEGRISPWESLLSFAPVLYFAAEVLLYYFDTSVAVNSPVKTFAQFIYLTYMLVFCAQTAVELGKGESFARYAALLTLGISIGGSLSLASLALTLMGAECTLFTGREAILRIAVLAYLCVRFVFLLKVNAEERAKKEKNVEESMEKAEEIEEETAKEASEE